MALFTQLFSNLIWKNSKTNTNDISKYVFYKIVNSDKRNYLHTLQCINTNAIFHANIPDIVFDPDILHGLHPIQACYIGIQYISHFKKIPPSLKCTKKTQLNTLTTSRYGDYALCYQNRKGDLCFINHSTNEKHVMDPRDIALSRLIKKFDAIQAFYIGMLAGLKMNTPEKDTPKQFQPPYLWLVK